MSTAPVAPAVAAADVEAWFRELGLEPLERADREGVTSWDLVLDGRRRAALRITVILDPALAVICWAHYAPPINDSFRVSYRTLLRWNDELPFVKFSVGEDERPLLVAEIPPAQATRDTLGLALARQVAVADRFHAETVNWLKGGGWPTAAPAAPRSTDDGAPAPRAAGIALVARYAMELGELAGDAAGDLPGDEAGDLVGDAAVGAAAGDSIAAGAPAAGDSVGDAAAGATRETGFGR
jgi:hypothetical protein